MPTVNQRIDPDDVWIWQGTYDASVGTFPASADSGYVYYISVAGTIDSVTFSVGDLLVGRVDGASTTTFANNWLRIAPTPTATVNDGNSIDFTASGTDNQTFTAEIQGFNAAADEQIFRKSGATGFVWQYNNKGRDSDGDTLIQLEETGDEDIIRFDAAGTEQMTIAESAIQLNADAADTLTIRGATINWQDAPTTDTQGIIRPLVLDGSNNVVQSYLERISDADGDTYVDMDDGGAADSDQIGMYVAGTQVYRGSIDATSTQGLNEFLVPVLFRQGFITANQFSLQSDSATTVAAAGTTVTLDAGTALTSDATIQKFTYAAASGALNITLKASDTTAPIDGVGTFIIFVDTVNAGGFKFVNFATVDGGGLLWNRAGAAAVTALPNNVAAMFYCSYNENNDRWDINPFLSD